MIADFDPSEIYKLAFKRDRGRCLTCGLDCVRLRKQMSRVISNVEGGCTPEGLEIFVNRLTQLHGQGFTRGVVLGEFRLWVLVYEILPEDGGPISLENVHTECLQCFRDTLARKMREKEIAGAAKSESMGAGPERRRGPNRLTWLTGGSS